MQPAALWTLDISVCTPAFLIDSPGKWSFWWISGWEHSHIGGHLRHQLLPERLMPQQKNQLHSESRPEIGSPEGLIFERHIPFWRKHTSLEICLSAPSYHGFSEKGPSIPLLETNWVLSLKLRIARFLQEQSPHTGKNAHDIMCREAFRGHLWVCLD